MNGSPWHSRPYALNLSVCSLGVTLGCLQGVRHTSALSVKHTSQCVVCLSANRIPFCHKYSRLTEPPSFGSLDIAVRKCSASDAFSSLGMQLSEMLRMVCIFPLPKLFDPPQQCLLLSPFSTHAFAISLTLIRHSDNIVMVCGHL